MYKFICQLLLAFFSVTVYASEKLSLNLEEAILLAVRKNPNVISKRYDYLLTKYNLYIQEWEFTPHYSLTASGTIGRQSNHTPEILRQQNFNLQPSMTIRNSIGTEFTLQSSNMATTHYNPGLTLRIFQPLIRGFGKAVVLNAYNNARDSEVASRLGVRSVLQTTVTTVIDAYLNVIAAEKSVLIEEDALKRAKQSVEQTKLFIKSGRKAGNELVTVEANVASSQSQLESNRNSLIQSRYALLTAIGLDPSTPVQFATLDVEALINKYHLPTLEETKELVLRNDIQYQISQMMLHGQTKRSLLLAEDNARAKLDLDINLSTGNGSGGGENAGFNSLFNGINQGQSVTLTLNVPINDQPAKQNIIAARIAIKQAEMALNTERWNLETNAINAWNLVQSAKRSLHFAKIAESLQERTYRVSYQKYSHGLIDSLELQTAQVQLIQSQQSLLNAQINYIKSLVTLDLLIGNTLCSWGIKVRLL